MNDIRKLAEQAERVETGTIQFGMDWPGTFIRGDDAAHYARILNATLSGRVLDTISRKVLEGLLSDLNGSNLLMAVQQQDQQD